MDPFSPPNPIQRRPSAVPAAITPVEDMAMQIIKGGASDMPPVVGAYGSTANDKEIKNMEIEGKITAHPSYTAIALSLAQSQSD